MWVVIEQPCLLAPCEEPIALPIPLGNRIRSVQQYGIQRSTEARAWDVDAASAKLPKKKCFRPDLRVQRGQKVKLLLNFNSMSSKIVP